MRTYHAGNKATILIVDDTPSNLSLISDLLKDDYLVKVATGGMRALEIARAPTKPDMILLDVLMPDIDGYAVCRELKSHAETKDIPIIFLTARTDPADEERGLQLGATDYISKPISPPVVLARIRTQLQLKGYAQRLQSLVSQHTAELLHTRQQFGTLLESSLALHYEQNVHSVLDNALLTGLHILNCDAGTFFLRTKHNTLTLAAHTWNTDLQYADIAFTDTDSNETPPREACALCMHLRKTMVIDNITQEGRFDMVSIQRLDQTAAYRTVSLVLVPVVARQGAILGVLCFQNALGSHPGSVNSFVPFDIRDISYVEAHAAQTAAALQRLR